MQRESKLRILVFNAGSSSLKFAVFDMVLANELIFKGEFKRLSDQGCSLTYQLGDEQGRREQRPDPATSLDEAIARVPALLDELGYCEFDAIGHRVVHGGARRDSAILVDDDAVRVIESLVPLAPLHNSVNLQAIRLSRQLWPSLPQVAVFDTAFHQTIPAYAYAYAVPKKWREHGVRRYGFHGLSHKYVASRAADALKQPLPDLKIISCHLGSGASVCAISNGVSVDTSMGMTPLEGLVMGTRSGDVDPGVFAYLARELDLDAQSVERELYRASGLKGLTGEHDLQKIEQNASVGDADAQLAIALYVYRVRKYIGAYAAAMGGLDALVFTGGVGENSASIRRRVCERFKFIGLVLDDEKNGAVDITGFEAPQIQSAKSTIKILVTQSREQAMIAQEVMRLLDSRVARSPGRSSGVPFQ